MSDFRETVKITEQDKEQALLDILQMMINSSTILTLSELEKREVINKLNEDEIRAIHGLAVEIKRQKAVGRYNDELFKHLNLGRGLINSQNLLSFVKTTVEDIRDMRSKNPNITWNLQIDRIFKRMKKEKLDTDDIRIKSSSSGNGSQLPKTENNSLEFC